MARQRRVSHAPSPRMAHGVVGPDGRAQGEAQFPLTRLRHGHDQRIVQIDHGRVATREDARLCVRIGRHGGIAVQMIRADVENGRRGEIERMSRLELVARELEHVEPNGLAGAMRRPQQVERRLAEIAAHPHLHPGPCRHAPEQRRHRALAVGAGDAGNRRVHGAREELDVAHDLQAAAPRLGEEGLLQRHARRDHDAERVVEQAHIETPEPYRNLRVELAQRGELRRLRPRVGDRQPPATLAQIAGAGEPGAPEAHDDRGGWLVCRDAHRSLRVASPASTRRREMIQNRTITFGSAQPLSSKW